MRAGYAQIMHCVALTNSDNSHVVLLGDDDKTPLWRSVSSLTLRY